MGGEDQSATQEEIRTLETTWAEQLEFNVMAPPKLEAGVSQDTLWTPSVPSASIFRPARRPARLGTDVADSFRHWWPLRTTGQQPNSPIRHQVGDPPCGTVGQHSEEILADLLDLMPRR